LIQAAGGMQATVGLVQQALAVTAEETAVKPVQVDLSALVIGLSDWEELGTAGQKLAVRLSELGCRLIWALPPGRQGAGVELDYGEPMPAEANEGWMSAVDGEAATLTGMIASGCHMVLALGDLRHLGGHPIAPVVRFGVDPKLRTMLSDDLDGWIEERTTEEWLSYLEAVASGMDAVAEQFGGDMFAIARLGPTL
jgi:hypothetical protein